MPGVLRLFLLAFASAVNGALAVNGYTVKWMWGDVRAEGSHELARRNSIRWSAFQTVKKTIADLQHEESIGAAMGGASDNRKRPVDLIIKSDSSDEIFVDKQMKNVFQAIQKLRKWKSEDSAKEEKLRIEEESNLRRCGVKWMYGDANAGFGHTLARVDPLGVRWSEWKSPDEIIDELREQVASKRTIDIKMKHIYGDNIYNDSEPWLVTSESIADAIREIKSCQQ